jgi:hypothetical protein
LDFFVEFSDGLLPVFASDILLVLVATGNRSVIIAQVLATQKVVLR